MTSWIFIGLICIWLWTWTCFINVINDPVTPWHVSIAHFSLFGPSVKEQLLTPTDFTFILVIPPTARVCKLHKGLTTVQPDPSVGLWNRSLQPYLCCGQSWAYMAGEPRRKNHIIPYHYGWPKCCTITPNIKDKLRSNGKRYRKKPKKKTNNHFRNQKFKKLNFRHFKVKQNCELWSLVLLHHSNYSLSIFILKK